MSGREFDREAWLESRRRHITSTDIPVILGLSPYKAEAELAAEKMGAPEPEPDPRKARVMRMGLRLESVIRAEDEVEHGIKLRRVRRFFEHRDLPWAATSLDFERVGERTIVEAKSSRSKRWDDGLPQDVEAQVRWQMGVADYPRGHVALLKGGSELECFDLEHDADTFAGLVDIAQDFRSRLAAGGPFSETSESVKRRWPSDTGAELVADSEIEEAVSTLLALRAARKVTEAQEEVLETAIKTRMADASVLVGHGWRATWKRTKDVVQTDWKSVADGLLRQLPEPERAALVGLATTVRPGFRPFRVVRDKEDSE